MKIKFKKATWERDNQKTYTYLEVLRRYSTCQKYMIENRMGIYFLYIKNNKFFEFHSSYETLKETKQFIHQTLTKKGE